MNQLFDFMPNTNKVTLDTFKPDASLLLHPSLPPALHGQNPRSIKSTKWWDTVRREAYAKHDYRCWACGLHKEDEFNLGRKVLDAHESYNFNYKHYSIELKEIVALCVTCHAFIHRNRMNALFKKEQLTAFDCWSILNHGWRTLENQGFPRKYNVEILYGVEDWDKWHLILDGEKYYSRFSGVEEWREFYDR